MYGQELNIPFRGQVTIHNNEQLLIRIPFVPDQSNELPNTTGWGFSVPVRSSTGIVSYGSVNYDNVEKILVVTADIGNTPGKYLVDILTNIGTPSASFRLGTIRVTMKQGAGPYV